MEKKNSHLMQGPLRFSVTTFLIWTKVVHLRKWCKTSGPRIWERNSTEPERNRTIFRQISPRSSRCSTSCLFLFSNGNLSGWNQSLAEGGRFWFLYKCRSYDVPQSSMKIWRKSCSHTCYVWEREFCWCGWKEEEQVDMIKAVLLLWITKRN